jgi:ABC-2 type transport system ATP-binding protein
MNVSEIPAIQTDNLTKRYEEHTALSGVSFQIPQGSVVGLLGRNGAGKSTLIHMLVGLIEPSSGTSRLFGEDSQKLSPDAKAKLGVVLQSPKYYDWLTGDEMLEYAKHFYPLEDVDLKARLMKRWGVPGDRKLADLSMGEMQKFACILAMAHAPELLILDEPCASLDPASRRDVVEELIDMAADSGKTILVSTHIVSDVERLANQVLILHKGRVVVNESIDTLKETVKRLRVFPAEGREARWKVPDVFEVRTRSGPKVAIAGKYTTETKKLIEHQTGATVDVEDLGLEDIFLELTREYP